MRAMVLCCVDDFMFSSKISAAAKGVGADLVFVRNPDDILPRVRELKPALVVLDLNAARLQPLKAIAAIRADPDTNAVRTVGYVSHVQTDVIRAARQAGCDEVLPRSAFSERLGEILSTPAG